MQPKSQIHVIIDRYLLAIIMFKWKRKFSYQFKKCPQNMIAMHAAKGLYTSCAGKHGGWYKRNFISPKPVLAFQTLTLATFGRWATTHKSAFFLGKNCSWTLLPGSIWLQTLITRLRYISCLRSFRTHFDSLKRADDLRVYQGFTMPLHHQAGISFDARSIHVLCSRHNNWCKQSVPRFPLYILFSFDLKTAKILWNKL